uniref:NADH-ubiquinone oxidoreductase chain 6 n=1 Tax=Rhoenanthus obscurus TaxID=2850857 RepID=A0AAU7YR82_9INSE
MLELFLMAMILTTGLLFCRTNHPLAMGLTLLFQTTFTSLISGLMAPSFWFSYILFLVFLGGMLVLFIYVTSLASNEMFSISAKAFILSILFSSMALMLIFISDPLMWEIPTSNQFLTSNLSEFDLLPSLLFKFYNSSSSILTILLVIYLFLTLLAVVAITNIQYGPLRPTN